MYYNSCNNREALVSVVRRPPHLEVERLLVPFECIVLANLYLPNLQKRHLVHASHNVTLKEPPTRLFTERGRVLCDRFNQATSSKRNAFDNIVIGKVSTWWKGAKELRKEWSGKAGTKSNATTMAI